MLQEVLRRAIVAASSKAAREGHKQIVGGDEPMRAAMPMSNDDDEEEPPPQQEEEEDDEAHDDGIVYRQRQQQKKTIAEKNKQKRHAAMLREAKERRKEKQESGELGMIKRYMKDIDKERQRQRQRLASKSGARANAQRKAIEEGRVSRAQIGRYRLKQSFPLLDADEAATAAASGLRQLQADPCAALMDRFESGVRRGLAAAPPPMDREYTRKTKERVKKKEKARKPVPQRPLVQAFKQGLLL